MIEWVRFGNFKSMEDLTVPLKPLTVLVGPNGSGKTSVLDGCQIFSELAAGPPEGLHIAAYVENIFRGKRAVGRLKTAGVEGEVTIAGRGSGGKFYFRDLTFLPTEEQRTVTTEFTFAGTGPPERFRLTLPLASADVVEPFFGRTSAVFPHKAMSLRLDARRLAEPSYLEAEVPTLHEDGFGLGEVLAWLAGNAHDRYIRIQDDLRKLLGFTSAIRTPRRILVQRGRETIRIGDELVTRQTEQNVPGHTVEVDVRGARAIPADLLSEGTLLALGLLTVIHGPTQPRLLLIDDIQRGLHPKAELDLIRMLKDLQKEIPDLQIICTTHSPFVLEVCEPDEVVVLALDESGRTRCKRLADHPDWPEWKGMLGAGEFWSTVGESWVTKEPARER